MVQSIKDASRRIVGLKQTLRVMQQDLIKEVYIACDTEEHILRKISEICREKTVPLIQLQLTKKELGRFCQIEVGAAIVAIMKD